MPLNLKKATGLPDYTWGDAIGFKDIRTVPTDSERATFRSRADVDDFYAKVKESIDTTDEWLKEQHRKREVNRRIEIKKTDIKVRNTLVFICGIVFPLLVNVLWWAK